MTTDTTLSILLVEDDAAHAEAVRRAFAASGEKAVVQVAGTLRDYREAVAAHPPDIALLDLVLPDGLALEALIFPPEAGPFPILVMTSLGNERTAVAAMKAGALDYIVKSPEAFAAMPRTVARARHAWNLIQERKQAEKKLKKTVIELEKAFGGIIQVLSAAVEKRDPYTAGHEKRVASLAREIGLEMGLDDDRLNALSMAGAIHDVGKISIPAEILSKPGQLAAFEYKLIQAHPQMGYDILKDIDFPWPIANIILQHHERMDGSGYPFGLKGQEILLEARILAAADIVEAMASHRPYRPSLGIDAALNEVEKNKGLLYDSDVAAACLKLFRQKGFSFEQKRSDSREQQGTIILIAGGKG